MTTVPTINTAHLGLRAFMPEDAVILYRIYQSEGVLQYFPNPIPPPLEKVQRFVTLQQIHWDKYGYGNWAVIPPGQSEIAGWAGLQFIPETGETEVGYLLDRPFWGKGYATEACAASLQFGFDHFDFPEIIALVHPGNLASLKVAKKCGLKIVERKTYWGLELVRHTIKRGEQRKALKISSGACPEGGY